MLVTILIIWLSGGLLLAWFANKNSVEEYHIATGLVILLGWPVLVIALLYEKLGGTDGNDREEK